MIKLVHSLISKPGKEPQSSLSKAGKSSESSAQGTMHEVSTQLLHRSTAWEIL